MAFAERLKEARKRKGITQAQLAKEVNMTARTIQNYELGTRKPQKYEVVERLAVALGVTADSLLNNTDMLIIDAHEKGGSKSARDIKALVTEVTGLFAGGEIDDSEKDEIMQALNFAYWESKKKNKKYTPKKYQNKHQD
jgi:transcriptional regulator with XRE-family HTH domain